MGWTLLHDLHARARPACSFLLKLRLAELFDLFKNGLFLEKLALPLALLFLAMAAPNPQRNNGKNIEPNHAKNDCCQERVSCKVKIRENGKGLIHRERVESGCQALQQLFSTGWDLNAAKISQVNHIAVHETVWNIVWRWGGGHALCAPNSIVLIPVLAFERDAAVVSDEAGVALTAAVLAYTMELRGAVVRLSAIASAISQGASKVPWGSRRGRGSSWRRRWGPTWQRWL